MADYGPSIHLEGLSREKHAELAAKQAQAKSQPRTIPSYPVAETRNKQGPGLVHSFESFILLLLI